MKSKKIIAGAAALLITLSSSGMTLPGIVPLYKASAAGELYTSGDWEYEKVSGGIKLTRFIPGDEYYMIQLPAELDGQKVVEISARILEENTRCYNVVIDDPSIPFDGNLLEHSNVYSVDCSDYSLNRFLPDQNVWEISYPRMYLDDSLTVYDPDTGEMVTKFGPEQEWFRENFCEYVDGEYRVNRTIDITVPATVAGADVAVLQSSCFQRAEVIDKVILPDTLRIVDEYCFANSSVKSVNIPENLYFLCDSCFENCLNLEKPEIPDSVVAVSSSAFAGTKFYDKKAAQASEVYGSSMRMYGKEGDWNVLYMFGDGLSLSVMPVRYCGKDTVVDYPEEISGYPVRYDYEILDYSESENSLLSGCRSVSEIRLPDKLDYIPLLRNSYIKSIDIPAGVTEIPIAAFEKCTGLTSLNIPSTVKIIGIGAFSGCSNLSDVKIEGDSIEIQWGCFENTNIKSIELPGNVVIRSSALNDGLESLSLRAGDKADICTDAFSGVITLRDLSFSPDLKEIYINDKAFYATGLEKLELGSNVKDISHSAFKECTDLKSLSLSGDSRIASEAFMNDIRLEKIVLKGVHKIERNAFNGCTDLKEIDLDLSCDLNPDAFNYCTDIEYINGIKIIGDNDTKFAPELSDFIIKNFDGSTGVGFMDRFVMNNVKAVVAEVTNDGMSDIEKAKALHDWVCDHSEYAETNYEYLGNHTDTAIFTDGVAVCEGYARTYNLLLNEAGIKSWYVRSSGHAWNVAMIDGEPFHIDTTWDDVQDTENWFMCSDKELKKTDANHKEWSLYLPSELHSFQTNNLPECTCFMGDLDGDGDLDTADLGVLRERIITGAKYDIKADLDFNGKAGAGDLAAAVLRLDSPGLKMGDVDLDGIITSADASLLLDEYSLMSVSDGKTFTDRQTLIADVNVDGQVNAADASAILGYYSYISTGGTDNISAYTENK